ncbi:unnamed protein product [Medioppia subpectinata]|uniref:Uncharacterized protein n=1 Tax=Medioppia subpectinata TaxID=1979941 RepID=A0A7R9KXS2_9ACAR|nr:unnamed protein product [Medioppia subpectinata]CAG2111480.1 unnamed protein product [Medioppia subpectinata]
MSRPDVRGLGFQQGSGFDLGLGLFSNPAQQPSTTETPQASSSSSSLSESSFVEGSTKSPYGGSNNKPNIDTKQTSELPVIGELEHLGSDVIKDAESALEQTATAVTHPMLPTIESSGSVSSFSGSGPTQSPTKSTPDRLSTTESSPVDNLKFNPVSNPDAQQSVLGDLWNLGGGLLGGVGQLANTTVQGVGSTVNTTITDITQPYSSPKTWIEKLYLWEQQSVLAQIPFAHQLCMKVLNFIQSADQAPGLPSLTMRALVPDLLDSVEAILAKIPGLEPILNSVIDLLCQRQDYLR